MFRWIIFFSLLLTLNVSSWSACVVSGSGGEGVYTTKALALSACQTDSSNSALSSATCTDTGDSFQNTFTVKQVYGGSSGVSCFRYPPPVSACGPDSTKTKGSPATSSGYFDMGMDMAGKTFPRVVCASGCLASFNGTSPATSAVVNGIKRYFAKGGYFYLGNSADTCTAAGGDPAPGSPVSEKPQDACRSDQIAGMINGKMNCWNRPETYGQPATQAPTEAPIEQTTTTNKQTTTNPDNSTTTTETTTKPDGSRATTTTTCQGGNCSTTQTEIKPAESEEFAAPMAGNFSEVGELVQADERTFGTVWASRRAELNASPLFGMVTSLTSFNATAASCPSFSLQGQIFGKSVGGNLSPPCWLWGVLKAFLVLTSLFVARRMIFGG